MKRLFAGRPSQPIAQLHLLLLILAELMAVSTGLQVTLSGSADQTYRLAAFASLLLLSLWWTIGYVQKRFPVAAQPVEAFLLLFAALGVQQPVDAARMFYVALFFRSLYARGGGLLPASLYAASLVGAQVIATGLQNTVASPLIWIQIFWLIVTGSLFYRFAGRLEELEKARDRERLLRTVSTRVVSAAAQADGMGATDTAVRLVLAQALKEATEFSGCPWGRVYVVTEGGASLQLMATVGVNDKATQKLVDEQDELLAPTVLAERTPIVSDGEGHPVGRKRDQAARSLVVALPLTSTAAAFVGVLVLSGKNVVAPDEQDLAALGFLASQLASLVEGARLREQLQHSLDSLRAIHEAGRSMNASLEAEQVWMQLLKTAGQILPFQSATIRLRNEKQELRVWLVAGDEVLAHEARRLGEVRNARRRAGSTGRPQLFVLPSEASQTSQTGWCLPLRAGDREIGTLEIFGLDSPASTADIETLESLASEAAIALENASLYGQLAERERRLHELIGRLLMSQEEERRRISYELHDGFVQMAASAHLHVQAYSRHHRPRATKAREDLDKVLRLTQGLVLEARDVIAGLRPTVLDDFGLAKAIRLEVEALQMEGWEVLYEEDMGDQRLGPEIETTLFRVAQEALRNAYKHSNAGRALVSLRPRDNMIQLEVRDWGKGFRLQSVMANRGPSERVGLAGMQERVALLSGRLIIRTSPGQGTRILAEVPTQPAKRNAAIA